MNYTKQTRPEKGQKRTHARPSKFERGNKVQPRKASGRKDAPIGVTLRVDKSPPIVLTPESIADDDTARRVGDSIKGRKTASIDLAPALQWETRDRLCLFRIIAPLAQVTFRASNGSEANDLLGKLLKLVPPVAETALFVPAKLAVLELLVTAYPTALEAAAERVADRFKAVGLSTAKPASIIRDAKQILAVIETQASQKTPSSSQRISDLFTDAPSAEGLVLPAGYVFNGQAIVRPGALDHQSIPAPMFISGRQMDLQRGTELAQLSYERDGKWRTQCVERHRLLNSRTIPDLAQYGMPVSSNNTKLVVDYLTEFEVANKGVIPIAHVTTQLGLHEIEGTDVFVLGASILKPSASNDLPTVVFRGADAGDDQMARGFHCAGSVEDWLTAVQAIEDHPRAQLVLYTSAAAPLVVMLGAPNFLLDISGSSSAGKTTALMVGASLWGNPEHRSSNPAVFSWDATAAWIDRAAGNLCGLPLFLDDSTRALNRDAIAQQVYGLAQGRGRQRGTKTGTAEVSSFRTITISTGEQPLTAATAHGGTRARVLTLWGSPFNSVDQHTGTVVRRLAEAVRVHYGHAGPQFVQYLLDHEEEGEDWLNFYQERVAHFEERAGANNLAARMAPYLSLISTAGDLLHRAVPLGWDYQDPCDRLWDELTHEAEDVAVRALRFIADWIHANPHRFPESMPQNASVPAAGWAGRLLGGSTARRTSDWTQAAFHEHVLRELLDAQGFDPTAILRAWADRRWLERADSRRKKRVRIEEETVWCIVIRRSAFEGVEPK